MAGYVTLLLWLLIAVGAEGRGEAPAAQGYALDGNDGTQTGGQEIMTKRQRQNGDGPFGRRLGLERGIALIG